MSRAAAILISILFCSQFVYTILDNAGAAYFDMQEGEVQPMDFIRQAGRSTLEFIGKIALNSQEGRYDEKNFDANFALNSWQS